MSPIPPPSAGRGARRDSARLRDLFFVAALGATAALHSGCGGPAAAPKAPSERKPDVLVIVLDAVRADRMGFDGSARPTTPELDRLAVESVHFTNAYSAATWTKPSIASLFTSRYPSEHGLLDLDFAKGGGNAALDESLPVVAESFRAGGWSTFAVVNQVHLTAKNGFARGFDQYKQLRGKRWPALNRRVGASLDAIAGAKAADGAGDRPFFGYVHYLDAHWPYDPVPKPLVAAFGDGKLAVEPPNDVESSKRWQKEHLDAAALAALESRYDAEIHGLDRGLGELFALLRARGKWDNTIVVVTADHGESFAERGELQHGHDPYVEQARVPLLVHLPERFAAPAGVRTTAIGHVDLAPTLLDLAGAPPLAGARGRSLRALLEGKESLESSTLTQAERAWSLRDARRTLLAFTDGRVELYDRGADPKERKPIDAVTCGAPCDELGSRLRRMKGELKLAVRIVPRRELTDEEKKELQALGYL